MRWGATGLLWLFLDSLPPYFSPVQQFRSHRTTENNIRPHILYAMLTPTTQELKKHLQLSLREIGTLHVLL
ncbi:hypothetical protein SAMN04488556_1446 [Halostagnicola kamekurae]|uniref:Uncharacterized protein n=1 Tax=Halostagnicola kamekurae TaxID=619731 RepID=A0A1I6QQH8_9EURY|nr:hypothetical protein SAMN04488556_1446 [Halostagnicola kamekurae]